MLKTPDFIDYSELHRSKKRPVPFPNVNRPAKVQRLPIRLVDKPVTAQKCKNRGIFIKRFFTRFAAGFATLCSLLFNFGKQPDRQG